VDLAGSISSDSSTLDAYFDDISLTLNVPELSVDKTNLDFGNLYVYDGANASVKTFNDNRSQTFTISNPGSANLTWNATFRASVVSLSSTSGSIFQGGNQTITVKVNPGGNGAGNVTIPITVNAGNANVTVSETAYGTPAAVTRVSPVLDTNNKVNVAINDSVKFQVSASAPPLYPGSIRGYQWQVVSGAATAPDATKWTEVNLPEYTAPANSFTTASDYKVYARMVDSNGVGAAYVEFPVKAWNRPTVGDTPPAAAIPASASQINDATKASWLANQYVGIVGQPVKLVADGRIDAGNADSTERIARYQWNAGTQGTVEQLPVNITAFNGTSDYIDLPLDVSETAYTLALRFKTTNANAGIFQVVDGLRGASGHDRHLFLSGGNLKARVYNDEVITASGTNNYADNQWHHVVHVYGGTVGGQKLYVDGVLKATGTLNHSDFTWQTGVNIGYSNDATSPYFSGNIEGVAIWSRALTEAEIQQVRNASPLIPYTTATPNLAGSIGVKAVNNYGIQSVEKRFNVKVYDTVVANLGGPYNGRPTKPVTLKGSINTNSYPTATFAYQWSVQQASGGALTNVTTAGDGNATYTWTTEGTYNSQFAGTVTTAEGLQITGNGDTPVFVQAGRPTATPGGPYRGGIAGGNFTPIPFEGNLPGFVEAADIGKIQAWDWTFAKAYINTLGTLKGSATLDTAGGFIQLTPNTNLVNGQIDYENLQPGDVFEIKGEFYSGGGTGADAAYIYLWASGTPVDEDDPKGQYSINYDEYQDEIQLKYNGTTLQSVPQTGLDNSQWRQFKVQFDHGVFRVYLDDVLKLEHNDTAYLTRISNTRFGIGARTGGLNHFHQVRNIEWITGIVGKGSTWNPAQAFAKAGQYAATLRSQSEFGKWSSVATTRVTVVDGKIEGFVRAADLRTPVRGVRLTLTSSHVDTTVLANIAAGDTPDLLNTNADGSLYTETDDRGFYRFEHIPLGSYRIAASKTDGTNAHEFETAVQTTELTLDGPNQLAVDFVDLSVFPVGGRAVYSLQKNGIDVLVANVEVKAQPVGSTSDIEALPSTKSLSATGVNYSVPLFAGKYLFLAKLPQHDIRIKSSTPKYDANTGLVTIEGARTDIDFVDYTTRTLTVFVADSGGFKFPGKNITVSGDNGQAAGVSDTSDERFVFTVNPGIYTVNVPGSVADDDGDPDSDPEQESVEVDLTALDQVVTLTIPVPIVLSISPAPRLFDATPEFLAQFGLTPGQNPEGYMFYYPPEPRTHTYIVTATANGNPVEDFKILVVDNVSQLAPSPAEEQEIDISGAEGQYVMTAGLPATNRTVSPPIAVPKTITFRAKKDKYQDSAIVTQNVTILGDLPVGTASRVVSVPIVNYIVLHDPPGDGSYSYFDDTLTVKGIVSGMKIKAENGVEIPVYPSPWSDERSIDGVTFEKAPNSGTPLNDLESKGLLGNRSSDAAAASFAIGAAVETALGLAKATLGPIGFALHLVQGAVTVGVLEGTDALVQYEISPNRHLETSSGDTLTDWVGPGKGDLYYGEGWTLGLQSKYRLGIQLVNGQWQLNTAQIETYDILERTNQYVYTIQDIVNLIADLQKNIDQATDSAEKTKLTNAKNTWQGLLDKNLAYQWHLNLKSETPQTFDKFKQARGLPDPSETLIFSTGPAFEYSRAISESKVVSYSTEVALGTTGEISGESETEVGVSVFGNKLVLEYKLGASFGLNTGVTVLDRLDQAPIRREFTFNWTEAAIRSLGVAEYQLRAVATDKASRLSADKTSQVPKPNVDLDPPAVSFIVDDSKPSVLTSLPDYQAREKDRLYRGELSVAFTDDMKSDDFSDRTFAVTDLLDNNAKVAGYVTYHPALRKAVFVPIVPFKPNGFYRAEVKTDTTGANNTIDRGVRDLAGNPLDNGFSWTFRTTDAPFEEQWSIALSVNDGTATDANNIVAVAYGASDSEDEKDARAVPGLTSQLRLSFLDRAKVEYERDIRPADGRLSHHWFFSVVNAASGASVKLRWRPSQKLTSTLRQYQVIRLVEFNAAGAVTNTVNLDPALATIDPTTGLPIEIDAYTYTSPAGETERRFRLDVMKVNLVATTFTKGSSGWKFFSAPITPQRADAFVNLGDDIDPFKMYQYDAKLKGYKIYPLDIGEVSLQTGRGYFTRLSKDAEVDVGGASNLTNVTLTFPDAGWHAIGNPFVLPVNAANLTFNTNQTFAQAVTANLIEGTLYRWKVDQTAADAYEAIDSTGQLAPWDGYWLKTKAANVTVVIPAPAGIANAAQTLPPSFNPPAAPPLASGAMEKGEFALRLAVTSALASDVTTALGTRSGASVGWDALDTSEPPTLVGTVSAAFDHTEWGDAAGAYNTDFQPTLPVGESRTWRLVVFADGSNADMTLSWEQTISQIPNDIMLYFRQVSTNDERPTTNDGWTDMRLVRSVKIASRGLVTKVPFEIRAERYAMSPIADLVAVAGEKQVTLRWAADDNPFIEGYTVSRRMTNDQRPTTSVLESTIHQFVDTDVEEDATYTYEVAVRFKSGAELKSDLMSVTVLPVIQATVLKQNYPNPFNPETWIPYELAKDAVVSVEIYNPMGQLVRTLDIGFQARGRYVSREKAAYWDGRNDSGEKVASGVYFYVFKASEYTQTRKMVILK